MPSFVTSNGRSSDVIVPGRTCRERRLGGPLRVRSWRSNTRTPSRTGTRLRRSATDHHQMSDEVRELREGGESVFERRAVGDELAVLHDRTRAVHPEHTDELAGAAVQRDEATFVERAVDDCGPRRSGRCVRRVGSCGRTGPTRTTAPARTDASSPSSRRAAWAPCSCAFSQCSTRIDFAEACVVPAGHVTRGDDAGRGEAGLVAHDAVVDRESGSVEPLGVGTSRRRRRRRHRRRPSSRRRARHRRPDRARRPRTTATPTRDSKVDTMVTVEVAAHTRTDLVTEHALQRDVQRFEQRDLEAALARRRRHLCADESCTHHDDTRRVGVEFVAQREAVVERAQGVDAGERRLAGQRPHPRARRDHETVERDRRAVIELAPRARQVERAWPATPRRQSTSSASNVDADGGERQRGRRPTYRPGCASRGAGARTGGGARRRSP